MSTQHTTESDAECDHPGKHCSPNQCLDCGRFSRHSWTTGWYQTQDGNYERWGGTCKVHGEWSETSA